MHGLTINRSYNSFLNDVDRVTSLKYMPNDGRIYCLMSAMESGVTSA